jgi:hypothetical protein
MSSSCNAIKAGGLILRYKNFRRFVTFCEDDILPLETRNTFYLFPTSSFYLCS